MTMPMIRYVPTTAHAVLPSTFSPRAAPASNRRDRPPQAAAHREQQAAIGTFLTPAEQHRVDAAGYGCYVAVHRDSMDDLLRDLRAHSVHAVLVSVARYQSTDALHVARLVREFPRVPAVALLTVNESTATQSVLALGKQGINAVVDAREARGWRELRQLFAGGQQENIETTAITRLTRDLAEATPDCLRFFEALFLAPHYVSTVQQLARVNGIVPSTFMSRFFRVGLPAPKRYLAMARLVRAARHFENPGRSITDVANHLEYSSAQSFSRHVQLLLDCTPMTFRKQFTGERMLDVFRETLVLPYRELLRTFEPFAVTPQWSVLRDRRDGPDLQDAELPAAVLA